jgi:peptidase E
MGTFLGQVKAFDVLYLHGGHNDLLFDTLSKFGKLDGIFKGKIVVGSSAGANLVAKNFWASSAQKPRKGKAVLDVNIMAHYGATNHAGIQRTSQNWINEEKLFRDFLGNDEKIWHIPEAELVIFETGDE